MGGIRSLGGGREESGDLLFQFAVGRLFDGQVGPVAQFYELLTGVDAVEGCKAHGRRGPCVGSGMDEEQRAMQLQ